MMTPFRTVPHVMLLAKLYADTDDTLTLMQPEQLASQHTMLSRISDLRKINSYSTPLIALFGDGDRRLTEMLGRWS
jgi:hypothetical protein